MVRVKDRGDDEAWVYDERAYPEVTLVGKSICVKSPLTTAHEP